MNVDYKKISEFLDSKKPIGRENGKELWFSIKCAVEKQIPKKGTPIDWEKYIGIVDNAKFLRGAYWCPNCKHVIHSGSYCQDCGQKLDWSDVD